jgi:cytochrome c553
MRQATLSLIATLLLTLSPGLVQDYRDGKRQDPMMGPVVKGLSDADIENLAAYYAGLKN